MEKEFDIIQNNFFKYLKGLGISAKSYKNYGSDISHFTNWLINKIKTFGSYTQNLTEAVPFINHDLAIEYKNEMVNSKPASIKTVNRRLSTLRHLARFLVSVQLIDLNFMEGIENVVLAPKTNDLNTNDPLLSGFRMHLEKEKVSNNTIKNYLSDTRQFLTWLDSNHQIQDSKF